MSAAPRPGWYPDPAGTPELYRWWDGGDWTEAISESPRAPTPRTHHVAEPAEDRPRRRPSRFRSVVALVVCLALFLSATVGLGLAIWHDSPSVQRSARPAGAARPEPAVTAGPAAGRLDERSRLATVGPASMTLPDRPYRLSADPMQVSDLLDVFFLASAPVHESYDGTNSWSAAVLLGRLSDPANGGPGTDRRGLDERGIDAVRGISATFFRSQPTELKRVAVAEHSVDGHEGVQITAEVHYEIPRLPSRHDRLTAVVVGLDDGSLLAAVSSVPDDADPEVTDRAASSLATLTVS